MNVGIILNLVVGLFFLIGIIVLNKVKNKEKLSIFTIALAFVVMLGLIILELIPELIETKNIWLIIPSLLGFIILFFLDKLIPHHHHEHKEDLCDKVDHNKHLNHIGVVTLLALAIHNIIEGISLYSVTSNSIKSGLLMTLSISLHNIPLGFQIGNELNIKKNKLLIIFLCTSSLLGALIMLIFGTLNASITNILLGITLGMLLYILIFELFSELRHNLKSKETLFGLIVGIILLIVSHMI